MTESSQSMLLKAEDALLKGDRRTAAVWLHKILLQDFTNQETWLHLHRLIGGAQPFGEFQQSFARKYYPQQGHLLTQAAAPESTAPDRLAIEAGTQAPARSVLVAEPVVAIPAAPQAAPIPPPAQPRTRILPGTALLSPRRLPYTVKPDRTCPICGAACEPQFTYCHFCGLPLTLGTKTLAGAGTLHLYRPKSSLTRDKVFNIWIDGKAQETIVENQERKFNLPAGHHTLLVKSASYNAHPVLVEIKPFARIRLACQLEGGSSYGTSLNLSLIPIREAPQRKWVPTRWELVWNYVRVFLILLFIIALGITLYSIISYMATH
jgi:hypothetical protein